MSANAPTDLECPSRQDAQPTLDALIEAHEQLDWSEVPSISNAEAAAWTSRLVEARSGGRDA